MQTQDTISKKKLDRIKIIYNGDVEIIDFLSDLKSRDVIAGLQDLIHDNKGLPCALLFNCGCDDIVVMILYKSPFAFNDPGNTLMLYAGNELHELMVYFRHLLDNTSKEKSVINQALTDIVQLLYQEWNRLQDDNVQSDFLG